MSPNFIVYALPRSRTAWLSRFLTFDNWHCAHEEMRHARSMADVHSWFAQPFTGTVETAAAPWWRLVPPGVRTVVVRRPVADVVVSLARLGMTQPEWHGIIERADCKLDQIEARVPCLSVQFADLDKQATCAAVFEHCLQQPHNPAWWAAMSPLNIQAPVEPMFRYFESFRPQLMRAAAEAKDHTLAQMRRQEF